MATNKNNKPADAQATPTAKAPTENTKGGTVDNAALNAAEDFTKQLKKLLGLPDDIKPEDVINAISDLKAKAEANIADEQTVDFDKAEVLKTAKETMRFNNLESGFVTSDSTVFTDVNDAHSHVRASQGTVKYLGEHKA